MERRKKEIVVLGAGFGGLAFCRKFRSPDAHITLVDRQNHHLFQPLLYQVATAGLSAPEIAQPIRSILADREDVTVLLENVKDIRLGAREVVLEKTTLHYDYLVLALGGVTSYFGHPEWEEFAPGLKTIDDAMRIRRDVLLAFERAENEPDKSEHDRLLTTVVVGGGPTGVEMAGALAELSRNVLREDFRRIDPTEARVLLIEAAPRLLTMFPPELSESAKEQLEDLGVEVHTGAMVKNIARGVVELNDGRVLRAENIIWGAGVAASSTTRNLGVALDRTGRIKVQPDLTLPGHPEVFAVGDIAAVMDDEGRPVPGVAPAAMQMGAYVAAQLTDEFTTPREALGSRPKFAYWDKGTMATIGRSAAVAKAGNMEFSGFPAWLAWLFIHLVFLVGFRNRIAVLLQWAYSYVAYKRGARIVFGRNDG